MVILLSLRVPPLKDCGAAYVHWPGPRAASLKMWSPAEQSSQSHPGGHPPVAEDTAVKGLWGSVCTWAGGPRCVVASGRRDHLDVPVVCFLKDYGLWWGRTLPHGSPFVDDTECRGYSSGPPWRRGYLQYPGSVVPVDEGVRTRLGSDFWGRQSDSSVWGGGR